jgi:hypothetical protein
MPSNVTRGNLEGLIAFKYWPTVSVLNPSTTVELDFTIPGVLANDVAISVSMPYAYQGLGIGNVRVKGNNVVSVVFYNVLTSTVALPNYPYVFFLGRVSNGELLPTVSF